MADYSNIPNEKFKKVYGKWAEGGWGMIITGWYSFTLPKMIFS